MKNKEHIQKQVSNTFQVLETIEKVAVNSFFKHKVLKKIEAEKVAKQSVFSWFTPQLQLATLGFILILNTTAIFYAYTSVESTNTAIDTFAQEYALQPTSNSILN
ncbi:hypothetical protein [uncultured Polaribacter sp.]|uniref:hypothetical protein n=1 Tax=uncultured Polaribacter sp. TaxID=174711 RepID=UPI00260ED628|nr:hypothetical protein [uncultured Polaribacter sp.]